MNNFEDIDKLYADARNLHEELSLRYDAFVVSSDVKFKFLRRLGFRFGFSAWVNLVVGLREVTTVATQSYYVLSDFPVREEATSRQGFDGVLKVFKNNRSLNEFYRKSYTSGEGEVLEQACLALLFAGVKPNKVGLEEFLECVAGNVSPSQAKEWVVLPSSFRSAFYS